MKVSEMMTRDVASCRPADTLERAAQIMWERDCGCVPVVDAEDTLHGMLTDRDVAMAAYTKGARLAAVAVEAVMAPDPRRCGASDDLQEALQTMATSQLRRLPVVDGQNRLVGLLSLADVAQAAARMDGKTRRTWTDGLLDTLIGVTEPRTAARAKAKPLGPQAGPVPALEARRSVAVKI